MDTKVIYQDGNVLVIDKPAGIAVQTSPDQPMSQDLANLLRNLDLSSRARLSLVHRLDKDTSGVLLLAKNAKTKRFLQQQFKNREAQKAYLALVEGVPKLPRAILDWPLGRNPKNPLKRAVRGGGKPAQTEYELMQTYNSQENPARQASLLEVKPRTGRTHQIRVHLSKLGHPVVGDSLYGHADAELGRHWLHASRLTIELPTGSIKTFKSGLPAALRDYLRGYNKLK